MASKVRRFSNRMKKKLIVTFLLVVVLFVGLMGRLTYINATSGKQYEKQVLGQQNYSSTVLPYARGEIKDRNGTSLAVSIKVYNLIIEPRNIIEADQFKDEDKKGETQKATVNALTKYFDISAETLNETISKNPKSWYNVMLKKLSYDEVKPFKEFLLTKEGEKVAGVRFEEEYKRSYPNNSLASNLIGFTSSGNVGNWGLEQYYNSDLNGINGREYGYLTGDSKLERTIRQPVNGNTIVSTIDINIQRIAEKHIKSYKNKIGADKRISVLIMDPNNGEVLAMASDNTYDLNAPRDEKILLQDNTKAQVKKMTPEEKSDAFNNYWKNPIITDTFEPGSTFKPFTIAAGMEENLLKGNETYYCSGFLRVGGEDIHCHLRVDGHKNISLSGSLEQSCNVALMHVNEANGPDIFSKYQKSFGFGIKTGIDLPGEASASSLLYTKEQLTPINMATNSFGQNFNCTMIQLGAGFNSLINGGYYYEPHVVKQIVNDRGGVVKSMNKLLVRNTVSKSTGEWLKQSLYETVERGTGSESKIKGYSIGGKTGTAQKHPRDAKKYLVSFISFAPVEKPQVMIYVVIDEPKVEPQSQSKYAVTLSKNIMKDLISYMNIPKSTMNTKKSKTNTTKKTTTKKTQKETQENAEQTDENSDTNKEDQQ